MQNSLNAETVKVALYAMFFMLYILISDYHIDKSSKGKI